MSPLIFIFTLVCLVIDQEAFFVGLRENASFDMNPLVFITFLGEKILGSTVYQDKLNFLVILCTENS